MLYLWEAREHILSGELSCRISKQVFLTIISTKIFVRKGGRWKLRNPLQSKKRKLWKPGYRGGLCRKVWRVAGKRPICSFVLMFQFLTISSFRTVRKWKCKLAVFFLPPKTSQRSVSIIWVWLLFASVIPLLVLCEAIKIICWSFFIKWQDYIV